ncbi:hypothetical protein CAOG_07930 [Capsaspora owczarzaki ATCC 30864]|uniref:SH3 domain-containing protein n=1 Tax=Capsaspora owczarzaki (strain ATCC 30864) TaxID=595528 RepID=A0A0D2W0S3_CAPO3|nr:hypothetical protein CAOG_07930 [Capsaspora owczarzaki ATCC 30864]KJE97847.1 hypothetical protein CAOG_007930 [Capsaspora owczarzaki ATCC 30864]|eukprot:XP_004343015.1 hypothetical protein CAOG_07930 [Capsaspora owczarzaki ATCC 30864]
MATRLRDFYGGRFLSEVDFMVAEGVLSPATAAAVRADLQRAGITDQHQHQQQQQQYQAPPPVAAAAPSKLPYPAPKAAKAPKHAPYPQPQAQVYPPQQPAGLRVRALYDNPSTEPDDLAFNAGDVIDNVKEVDADWYQGSLAGRTGIFPRSFVEPLPAGPPQQPYPQQMPVQQVVVAGPPPPTNVVVVKNDKPSTGERMKDHAMMAGAGGFGWGIGRGLAGKII